MKTFSVTFLALLASSAVAVPAILGINDGITKSIRGVEGTFTTAIVSPEKTGGGGLISPNSISAGPALVTFTVVNKHSAAISTSHAHQQGGPTAVSGDVGEGTMAPHATASFVVPGNWSGNVAINDARYGITGDLSLIEANYRQSQWSKVAVVDLDVSYVDGFSLPITCSCNGVVVTGCNKNLSALSTCPNNDGQNACINPKRADNSAKVAAPFFAPCQGAAYTFPKDNGANSYGECQIGQVSCCVGTDCPPSVKQTGTGKEESYVVG